VAGHFEKLSAARAISSEKIQENGATFEYHGPRESFEWQSLHDLLKIVSTESGATRLASIALAEGAAGGAVGAVGAIRVNVSANAPSVRASGSRRAPLMLI
jgi:hypothetical protein